MAGGCRGLGGLGRGICVVTSGVYAGGCSRAIAGHPPVRGERLRHLPERRGQHGRQARHPATSQADTSRSREPHGSPKSSRPLAAEDRRTATTSRHRPPAGRTGGTARAAPSGGGAGWTRPAPGPSDRDAHRPARRRSSRPRTRRKPSMSSGSSASGTPKPGRSVASRHRTPPDALRHWLEPGVCGDERRVDERRVDPERKCRVARGVAGTGDAAMKCVQPADLGARRALVP